MTAGWIALTVWGALAFLVLALIGLGCIFDDRRERRRQAEWAARDARRAAAAEDQRNVDMAFARIVANEQWPANDRHEGPYDWQVDG